MEVARLHAALSSGRNDSVNGSVARATGPFRRATSPPCLRANRKPFGWDPFDAGVGGKLPPTTARLAVPPKPTASLRPKEREEPSVGGFITVASALALACLLCAGCATTSTTPRTAEAEVHAVLADQVREWNAGRLDGFMEGYARSATTRFASGGDVMLGWQTVLERYQKRYGDRAAMGTLTFTDLDITVLAPDAAVAFGQWHLKREKDAPHGLFTLLLRRTPAGWKVVHDHTSSAETK
jgi:ketosteroid isomerase-like protein